VARFALFFNSTEIHFQESLAFAFKMRSYWMMF